MTPHFNCPNCGQNLQVQSPNNPIRGIFASGSAGNDAGYSLGDMLEALTNRKTTAVHKLEFTDIAIPAIAGAGVFVSGMVVTLMLDYAGIFISTKTALLGSLIAGGVVCVSLFGVARSTLHSVEESTNANPSDIKEMLGAVPVAMPATPPAQIHRVQIETKHTGQSFSRSWLELPKGVTADTMRRIAELARGNTFAFSRPYLCDTMKVLSQGKYNKLKKTLESAGMVESLAGNRTELTHSGRALLRSYLPATAH